MSKVPTRPVGSVKLVVVLLVSVGAVPELSEECNLSVQKNVTCSEECNLSLSPRNSTL